MKPFIAICRDRGNKFDVETRRVWANSKKDAKVELMDIYGDQRTFTIYNDYSDSRWDDRPMFDYVVTYETPLFGKKIVKNISAFNKEHAKYLALKDKMGSYVTVERV